MLILTIGELNNELVLSVSLPTYYLLDPGDFCTYQRTVLKMLVLIADISHSLAAEFLSH